MEFLFKQKRFLRKAGIERFTLINTLTLTLIIVSQIDG